MTAAPAVRRVLLTGDVHGNTSWVTGHVLSQAKKHRCDLILQLGDFGIWPGNGGRRYLDVVDRAAARARIPIWFIDGNHEDFEQLSKLPLDGAGRRPVRDNITHLPRGYRWEWAGRIMLACGGASSVDVMSRLPGVSWWPQEAITREEVDRCVAGGRADVLFSHDICLDVDLVSRHDGLELPAIVQDLVYANRLALQTIVDGVTPRLQVHGHWHIPRDQFVHRGVEPQIVRVVSLNCDSGAAHLSNGHCAVLDLEVLAEDVVNAVKVID
jgi:hypothetical protein